MLRVTLSLSPTRPSALQCTSRLGIFWWTPSIPSASCSGGGLFFVTCEETCKSVPHSVSRTRIQSHTYSIQTKLCVSLRASFWFLFYCCIIIIITGWTQNMCWLNQSICPNTYGPNSDAHSGLYAIQLIWRC